MREIVVISGKGGTGKTTVCAAFAALAHAQGQKAVLCDLDVDVPDMHILLNPQVQQEEVFISGNTARINPDLCTACGRCAELCRFDAVRLENGLYCIDELGCEGCGVCHKLCPAHAVEFPERRCGVWYVSDTRFGPFVHAQLDPGQENSGRLVALLKRQARDKATSMGADLVLCDGSPGVGCPVISSLSGAALAVAVVEPTPSGRHDFARVAELCAHFRIPVAVLINKADLNADEVARIHAVADEGGHHVVGELPFSPLVTQAMVRRQALTEEISPLTKPLAETLAAAWERVCSLASQPGRQGDIKHL